MDDLIRKKFLENPRIKEMQERKMRMIRTMNFVGAAMLEKEIERRFEAFTDMINKDTSTAIEAIAKMGGEDAKRNLTNFYTMLMMINIMDFMIADMHESLKRHGINKRFTFFDKLMNMGKELEWQVSYLTKNTEENFIYWFAVKSDELQEKMMKEVREEILPFILKRIDEQIGGIANA